MYSKCAQLLVYVTHVAWAPANNQPHKQHWSVTAKTTATAMKTRRNGSVFQFHVYLCFYFCTHEHCVHVCTLKTNSPLRSLLKRKGKNDVNEKNRNILHIATAAAAAAAVTVRREVHYHIGNGTKKGNQKKKRKLRTRCRAYACIILTITIDIEAKADRRQAQEGEKE